LGKLSAIYNIESLSFQGRRIC